MKKVILVFLLASTLFHLSCEKEHDAIPEFSLDQVDHLTADEYEIYGIILARTKRAHCVVRQQTTAYTPPKENFELFFNLDRMSNMEPTLFSSYVEENAETYFLDEKIKVLTQDVKLISNQEYAYYFDREDLYKGWDLFEKKYPDAGRWFYSFNKIGFNESRTQAMVGMESYWFMENPDGPTLKLGGINYLEKKNGVWEYVHFTTYRL